LQECKSKKEFDSINQDNKAGVSLNMLRQDDAETLSHKVDTLFLAGIYFYYFKSAGSKGL
jgi:hypothetical protein